MREPRSVYDDSSGRWCTKEMARWMLNQTAVRMSRPPLTPSGPHSTYWCSSWCQCSRRSDMPAHIRAGRAVVLRCFWGIGKVSEVRVVEHMRPTGPYGYGHCCFFCREKTKRVLRRYIGRKHISIVVFTAAPPSLYCATYST